MKKTLELDTALAAFEKPAEETLNQAVAKATADGVPLNLMLVPDDDLTEVDTVRQSRLLYVASQLKLLAYLREDYTSPAAREGQAKVALGYLRHAEGNSLNVLHLGRTTSDDRLLKEVSALKAELNRISEAKAKLLAKGKNGR